MIIGSMDSIPYNKEVSLIKSLAVYIYVKDMYVVVKCLDQEYTLEIEISSGGFASSIKIKTKHFSEVWSMILHCSITYKNHLERMKANGK